MALTDITVHRYGIFKFRTSSSSCPTTPSSTGHRLRPSMLNLDMISRNLFGHGTMNNRGQVSDMFGTASTRRKSTVSRTSTIDTRYSQGTASSDERPRLSRLSSSPSERLLEVDHGLPNVRKPYVQGSRGMGQSELDLNERLNLARKNSKTMAAMSPPGSRLAAKSVAELRSKVEEQDVTVQRQNSRLAAKSVGDLRRPRDLAEESEIPPLPPCQCQSRVFVTTLTLQYNPPRLPPCHLPRHYAFATRHHRRRKCSTQESHHQCRCKQTSRR